MNFIKMSAKKQERIDKMKQEVSTFPTSPRLAIVVCQDYDQSSTRYVNNKIKIAKEIGIECEKIEIKWKGLTERQIFNDIVKITTKLNYDSKVNGIIIQLPLPISKLHEDKMCNMIYNTKDVDGFHVRNLGKMLRGEECFISCTPLGVLNMLEDYNVDVEGKKVAVIGRSKHVGMPLVNLLIGKGATVTSCNSKTKNIEDILIQQDIVISAVGKAKIWNKSHFNSNAILIDIGINVDENGKLCGDIDFEDVSDNVGGCSPVPGGTGIMTVLSLMENTIKSYKNFNNIG